MNQFLKRAKELESQLQTDRRYLHQHAEAGEDLPNTTRYVMERLREIGLTPTEICPSGVTALIEGCKAGKGSSSSCRYGCSSNAGEQRSSI